MQYPRPVARILCLSTAYRTATWTPWLRHHLTTRERFCGWRAGVCKLDYTYASRMDTEGAESPGYRLKASPDAETAANGVQDADAATGGASRRRRRSRRSVNNEIGGDEEDEGGPDVDLADARNEQPKRASSDFLDASGHENDHSKRSNSQDSHVRSSRLPKVTAYNIWY